MYPSTEAKWQFTQPDLLVCKQGCLNQASVPGIELYFLFPNGAGHELDNGHNGVRSMRNVCRRNRCRRGYGLQ